MELKSLEDQVKKLVTAVNEGFAKQDDISKRLEEKINETQKRFNDKQARMEKRFSERQALMEERVNVIFKKERFNESHTGIESKIDQEIDMGELNTAFSDGTASIPLAAIAEGSSKTVKDVSSHTVDSHFADVRGNGESP